METSALYRVQREDLPRLQKMLTECFAEDPLYHTLIPDPETRKRLMPELFECDLNEFYETCEIYAESPELKGLLVVSDEAEEYDPIRFYLTEAWASLKTERVSDQRRQELKDPLEFHPGTGLSEFPVDSPAPPGKPPAHHLSGSEPRGQAYGGSGDPHGRGDPLLREPPDADLPGDPQ